jgi:hypothetical protein
VPATLVSVGFAVLSSVKSWGFVTVHHRLPIGTILLTAAVLLLGGCGLAPVTGAGGAEPAEAGASQGDGETLMSGTCDCPSDALFDAYDEGVRALAAGQYEAARSAFAAYAASGGEGVAAEATTATDLSHRLEQRQSAPLVIQNDDQRSRVTITAMVLQMIVQLEAELTTMSESNQALSAELAKREDALKRLRELTLGQPEG